MIFDRKSLRRWESFLFLYRFLCAPPRPFIGGCHLRNFFVPFPWFIFYFPKDVEFTIAKGLRIFFLICILTFLLVPERMQISWQSPLFTSFNNAFLYMKRPRSVWTNNWTSAFESFAYENYFQLLFFANIFFSFLPWEHFSKQASRHLDEWNKLLIVAAALYECRCIAEVMHSKKEPETFSRFIN